MRPETVKMATSFAPLSSVRSVSPRLATGEGLAGSVRSIIWTPSSVKAATTA